jgi:hypothetical protein
MSRSSPICRTRRPASCSRPDCAKCSRTTGCRTRIRLVRARSATRARRRGWAAG